MSAPATYRPPEPHVHVEEHFTASEVVRDVVIGMSDGLTVPFALAAGLSGAVASTGIVVTAGLAEIAAGSIAMGLGGYLAARSEADHWRAELAREEREVIEKPDFELAEVREVFEQYGVPAVEADRVARVIAQNPKAHVDFMMRFELGLEEPHPQRANRSAATIAASYIVGGLVPLAPYMFDDDAHQALLISVAVTLIALFIFGWVKGRFTGLSPLKGALQTTAIGGAAAGAAYLIASWIA